MIFSWSRGRRTSPQAWMRKRRSFYCMFSNPKQVWEDRKNYWGRNCWVDTCRPRLPRKTFKVKSLDFPKNYWNLCPFLVLSACSPTPYSLILLVQNPKFSHTSKGEKTLFPNLKIFSYRLIFLIQILLYLFHNLTISIYKFSISNDHFTWTNRFFTS